MPWKQAPDNDKAALAEQAREEADRLGKHAAPLDSDAAGVRSGLYKLADDLDGK